MDNTNSNSANNNGTSFDSETVKIFLETAKSEYDNEHSRTSVIDSKTSIALPIISTYCLALAQMNDYKNIFSAKINTFFDLLIPASLFLTFTISLVLALISVVMMSKVISMRNYKVLRTLQLYDEEYLKNNPIFLSIKLANLYIDATEENRLINDGRIPSYKKAWALTVVSIIIFVCYIVLKNIVG